MYPCYAFLGAGRGTRVGCGARGARRRCVLCSLAFDGAPSFRSWRRVAHRVIVGLRAIQSWPLQGAFLQHAREPRHRERPGIQRKSGLLFARELTRSSGLKRRGGGQACNNGHSAMTRALLTLWPLLTLLASPASGASLGVGCLSSFNLQQNYFPPSAQISTGGTAGTAATSVRLLQIFIHILFAHLRSLIFLGLFTLHHAGRAGPGQVVSSTLFSVGYYNSFKFARNAGNNGTYVMYQVRRRRPRGEAGCGRLPPPDFEKFPLAVRRAGAERCAAECHPRLQLQLHPVLPGPRLRRPRPAPPRRPRLPRGCAPERARCAKPADPRRIWRESGRCPSNAWPPR